MCPETQCDELTDSETGQALRDALETHRIDFHPDFPVSRITAKSVLTGRGGQLDYDLLMLLPPVRGASAVRGMGITDSDGFIRVDQRLRVRGVEGMYAIGNCVNFPGPKMGRMAVSQEMVAAANLASEVEGQKPLAKYEHEMTPAVDEEGRDSLYLHKRFWGDGGSIAGLGRILGDADLAHQGYRRSAHA